MLGDMQAKQGVNAEFKRFFEVFIRKIIFPLHIHMLPDNNRSIFNALNDALSVLRCFCGDFSLYVGTDTDNSSRL